MGAEHPIVCIVCQAENMNTKSLWSLDRKIKTPGIMMTKIIASRSPRSSVEYSLSMMKSRKSSKAIADVTEMVQIIP